MVNAGQILLNNQYNLFRALLFVLRVLSPATGRRWGTGWGKSWRVKEGRRVFGKRGTGNTKKREVEEGKREIS